MKRMDRASIESWYRKYGPMVLRRARAILGDESAAQDALQEVFMRVMRRGDDFRGAASPSPWLYRVTTNYCLTVIRDRDRRRELLSTRGRPEQQVEPHAPEEKLTIARVLSQIPDELREIAIYYYVDKMNQDEIATLLGLSRRTVGNRLESFRSIAQSLLGTRLEAVP